MAVLAIGWSAPVSALDEDLSVKINGIAFFGQATNDKKVTARDSEGNEESATKAKAAELKAMLETGMSFTYESEPLIFNVKLEMRTDNDQEANEESFGYIKWEIDPNWSLKIGSIEPDETNSLSWNSGTGTHAMSAQGWSFHGLMARISRNKGMEVRYSPSLLHSFGIGLYTEDVYYSPSLMEIATDVRQGFVDAKTGSQNLIDAGFCSSDGTVTGMGTTVGVTAGQCIVAALTIDTVDSDITLLDNADTEGEGSAWHVGYVGRVVSNPRIDVTAAYVSSTGDKGDGGPVNQGTGQQLSVDMDVLKDLALILDYTNSVRTAQTGIQFAGYIPTKEMNTENAVTETAMQLKWKGLGPGTAIFTYGSTTFTMKIFGPEYKPQSGKTTDIDFVYDVTLSENKRAGMRVALLTKKTEYNDPDIDPVNRQFVGVGLYSKF